MAVEIERKFLVRDDSWRSQAGEGVCIVQGYIANFPATVRVRLAGKQGFLTLKGGHEGIRRQEYEYEIPVADAKEMLTLLCRDTLIEKMRYPVMVEPHLWIVDVFGGRNAGLIVAEIELEREDCEFTLPPWAGEEVSPDKRYSNAALARTPFLTWIREGGANR